MISYRAEERQALLRTFSGGSKIFVSLFILRLIGIALDGE